jgi:hypothetical protein
MRADSDGGGSGALLRAARFLLLTLVLGYAGATVFPVVSSTFKFSQAIQHEVMYGTANEPAALIHRRLVGEASRLGLNVPPDSIVIEQRGARLQISANYVARIQLPGGFTVDWPFDTSHEGTRRPPTFGSNGP